MLARGGLIVLGLLTGLLAAVVHRHQGEVLGVGLPWGVLLALAATTAVAWACAVVVEVGAAWFGFGWTTCVLLQQSVRPGSYLVAGDAVGWAFMGGGLALIVGVVIVSGRPTRRAVLRGVQQPDRRAT